MSYRAEGYSYDICETYGADTVLKYKTHGYHHFSSDCMQKRLRNGKPYAGLIAICWTLCGIEGLLILMGLVRS